MEEKKKHTICGISLIRILDYFFIYSIVGFIIETCYALFSKGVLESRQSFLYGPFCSIYGIGAVIMILGLNLKWFKKNNFTIFIGGFIIGSIVEYTISLIGELIFNITWWDYSDRAFNLNGRICIVFSFFWGVLAVFLMSYFNPKVDKFIDRVPKKLMRTITILGVTILFIDCVVTGVALEMFSMRLVENKGIELKGMGNFTKRTGFYATEFADFLDKKVFTDEKIIKTFPNIMLKDVDNNIIYVKDLFPEITPYYLKLF